MSSQSMLTTTDNPYDPFEQFDDWLSYDNEKEYNSCGYLMRIAQLSDGMTQKEESEEIERAIDEILSLNPLGIYKKVTKEIKEE